MIHENRRMWLGGREMRNHDDSCINLLLQQTCIKSLLVMWGHVADGAAGDTSLNKTKALLFETYVLLKEDRKYVKGVGWKGWIRRIWGLIKEKDDSERGSNIQQTLFCGTDGVAWERRLLPVWDHPEICGEEGSTQTEQRAKEALGPDMEVMEKWAGGRRELERGFCIYMILFSSMVESLWVRELWGPSTYKALSYQWATTFGCSFKGYTKQAGSKCKSAWLGYF